MKKKSQIHLLFFIVLFSIQHLYSYSQNSSKIDSLIAITTGNFQDTLKVQAYSQLSTLWLNADNKKALDAGETGLKLANKIQNERLIAICLNKIGNVYTTTGEYTQSIECFEKMLSICIQINDSLLMAKPYLNMGNAYRQLGKYEKSTELYHKSLQIYEKFNNEQGVANASINLGIVYYNLRDFESAKTLFKHAADIYNKSNNPNIAYSYLNLGNIYNEEGVNKHTYYDSALIYYQKSYQLFDKMGNKKGVSMIANNIASVYLKQKNYDKAEINFLKALSISTELQDKENLSTNYKNLALIANSKENYLKAIDYANKGITIAKEQGMQENLGEDYKYLSEAYDKIGNAKLALYNLKLFNGIYDSIRSIQMTKNLTEIQTKYETEKKQQEIELQQVELKQQKTQKYAFVGGLLLTLFMLAIATQSYRQKREDNKQLSLQKAQIEKIHSELTSSIRYSKRIQQAVLPTDEKFTSNFFESFVFYVPRELVSGDFYWTSQQNQNIYIAIADCTGHGVPGALMSMLGISFLHEIVDQKTDMLPSEILDKLREYIIKSLKQKGVSGEQKDGMDISIIRLNTTTQVVDFAGANNPMLIFRAENSEMEEILANKMPVAIHEKMQPFTNHTIKLNKNDIMYLFTDGYKDQFGGLNGKKFMSRQFKQLLSEIHDQPVTLQKEMLAFRLNKWINESVEPIQQTDDITILGLRLI